MDHLGGSENKKQNTVGDPKSSAQTDALSLDSSAALRAELEASPVTRTEKVEAAKALIVSPNYPPAEIIRRISELLISTPDLTSEI
jgi:hypothetical protein